MAISRLRISHLRNILSAELTPSRLNLLFGANASGKTSILESVYLLGSGRSFRTTRLDPLINQESTQCTVHALLKAEDSASPLSIGVARYRNGDFEGRVQGRAVRTATELARSLPVLLINSATFGLLEGGPKMRRQFLDWGVFHVEPGFHQAWLQAYRSLKHRNILLRRDKISDDEMDTWNAHFIHGASELDAYRRHHFEAFLPIFTSMLDRLVTLDGFELSYARGWDRDRELRDVLATQFQSDRERGFTYSGPHRADMRARLRGMEAIDTLSRGQQKLVVCAMKLAQARVLLESRAAGCVFLIDDLPAELDRRHRRLLCEVLDEMQAQVMITCVDQHELMDCWSNLRSSELTMFHVEHGNVAVFKQGELNG